MHRLHRVIHLTPLVLAVLLGACGNDGTGLEFNGLGSFSATVTGDVSGTYSGQAVFGTDALPTMQTFGFGLTDSGATVVIDVVQDGPGRLGVGTHTLGGTSSGLYGEFGSGSNLYVSVSGTVTITESSSTGLAGSLSFTADNAFGPGTVNVSATFQAVCFANTLTTCD